MIDTEELTLEELNRCYEILRWDLELVPASSRDRSKIELGLTKMKAVLVRDMEDREDQYRALADENEGLREIIDDLRGKLKDLADG